MISELSAAIAILINAPKAAKTVVDSGKAILNALSESPDPVPRGIYEDLVTAQIRRLDDANRRFSKYDMDQRFSGIDKEEYRERLKAELASVIKELKPIAAEIPKYDSILALLSHMA